jgi:hypothetical protein
MCFGSNIDYQGNNRCINVFQMSVTFQKYQTASGYNNVSALNVTAALYLPALQKKN